MLTTAGKNLIAAALTNIGSPTLFTNANSYIGLGDSTTAESASHTDLQASTNKVRVGMESGYPSVTNNVITFKAVFGAAQGNFAVNEWGVFNASSSGTMLSRKQVNVGTKNGGTWTVTVTLTIG
mgnify:CR=1 FL=1